MIGKRNSGFSIIEILIALLLVVFGFFTFFSVFSTSSQHATQTRNRAVANLLAQSYIEEFKAHSYGSPASKHWEEVEDKPLRLYVRGRMQKYSFHKTISYKNRSFIGESDENSDLVTLVISWREGVGTKSTGANAPDADDNKQLDIQVPVWR